MSSPASSDKNPPKEILPRSRHGELGLNGPHDTVFRWWYHMKDQIPQVGNRHKYLPINTLHEPDRFLLAGIRIAVLLFAEETSLKVRTRPQSA